MSYLYKFKSGNDRDINALLANQLWVSNYDSLNDPIDFPIYVKPGSPATLNDIETYIDGFRKNHCCMAFSRKINNKRLWNYYTDGMKGMAIAYEYDAIRNALEYDKGIKTKPISQQQHSLKTMNYAVAIEGFVKYDGAKVDLTACVLPNNGKDILVEEEAFFHKDDSWQNESEYRFVFDFNGNNGSGFLLNNLIPSHVFIGNRMAAIDKDKIEGYCQKNRINLYEYRSNYNSRSCKQFIRKAIYNRDASVIGKEWPQTLK